jgi:hypothetical protein
MAKVTMQFFMRSSLKKMREIVVYSRTKDQTTLRQQLQIP